MDDINFVSHLSKFIGETVTIFTESGGDSGSGFTGILLSVNSCYVRLTTQVGPAPGCALGNCCSGIPKGEMGMECGCRYQQRFPCKVRNVGSISDIPLCKIVAFVHNSIQ
ncbi:hypothetical protein Z959_07430 [Clostridium novyi B str. ATCC 27606]|uniref:Uncharacterized protein n=3 Tax=Clostridium TaxID=1485 RepID=A0AA40IV35_CLONO|nr:MULTISPECIES: hypothetical protein [Clostridium]KEI12395.1 hypothetical protein Z958_07080 [Clostridium novyi B str. NCTC 9691]KEI15382.1 hypothetical protein Z960_00815 [Clostridium haemolyticum NCTC 9693]KEI17299.1 hypothetical protein Z959_07430 [Clostridium novyi B str. ATCC 27606]KGN04049.1 hypothetical protein Z961_05045 [Clostridium haemolyticum NCTC 8350]OOB75505.1 hypothetical protein AXF41_08130 [Clostridium haemolyticum]